MANVIHLTVENPDELRNAGQYGTSALIALQTATTKNGTYAAVSGAGSTPTIAITAGVLLYDGYDPNGSATSWYRSRYEGAGRSSEWVTFQVAGLDAYASLALFRAHIRSAAVGDDDLDPDSTLEALALVAAARAIDRATGRDFRPPDATVETRYFSAYRPGPDPVVTYDSASWVATQRHRVLNIDDVFDATGMVVTFDVSGDGLYTYAVTGYRPAPQNAPTRAMPYTQLVFNNGIYPPTTFDGVKVDALFGWPAVPSTIVNANLIQAARFLKRRDAAFGIAGSPDMGNEMRLLAKLDPDVALMVAAYKRNWGAV